MALKISPWFMTAFTIVQATTLMAFTAAAYRCIRHRNIAQHREWMVRGYAVVLVFLEGRVLMAIPAIARHGMDSVVLVNWGCFALSLVIADFALRWNELFSGWSARKVLSQAPIAGRDEEDADALCVRHSAGRALRSSAPLPAPEAYPGL